MKKPNKDQHDVRSRRPPREVALHALIFGGTASATTPLGTSVPMVTGLRDLKYPNATGE
jgi:hypothetical protein